ncbi:MAG TPA: glycosyltransferase family 2 protein [Ktedonobacteraceae bacterium]|nr:glycosyltransferase family 2 protein [Ktedonobacteraceae bacterium]
MRLLAQRKTEKKRTRQIAPLDDYEDQASVFEELFQSDFPDPGLARQAERSRTKQDIKEQVARYTAWLAAEASRPVSNPREALDYQRRATAAVHTKGRNVRTFAPFNQDLSALQTLSFGQAIVLTVLAFGWALAFFFNGLPTLEVSIAVVTALYLGDLLLNFFLTVRILTHSPEDHIDDAVVRAIDDRLWPRYTILCPLYREAVIVPQFVQAMRVLDYPIDKLQVLFLTEEDDVETREAILSMELPPYFRVITVPPGEPRTKPRACNFGLLRATGDYIVIYDAEDVPDPLQLKKAVLAFSNHPPEVACIQAKLNFYNPTQNLLTRWFTVEYSLWFDLNLPALQNARVPIPLGGTSNHFRTAALRKVGGWDPFNVTEDCDLGLRLAHFHLETAILESTTYEEANSRLKNWLRQRSRWIKGYMQTYLVHMRHPLRYWRERSLRDFFGLQFLIGTRVGLLFINPLMWLLLLAYIAFQAVITPLYHILYPRPVLYPGAACLIIGNFFYLYIHLVGCIKRKQYGLMKWALLVPFYWAMMSIAASVALVQLIFKPHYWEKTQHGFHLLAHAQKKMRQARANAARNPGTGRRGAADPHVAGLPIATVIDHLSTWRMRAVQKLPAKLSSFAIADQPTMRLSALVDLPTLRMPAMKKARELEEPPRRKWRMRLPWTQDRWLGATILTATIISCVAFWYSFNNHLILLVADSYSHMRIARSIFDSMTPGIGQFGGVWLPLPHVIMLPFIWNNALWRTGLAGSFSSMPCYVVAAIYLYLSARRLTHNGSVSFVAALAFILNPNVLYLQTTPLTEPVLMATMTAACYYFLAWAQENDPKQLIWAASAMFLATLARYDGWALFLVCLVLIVPIGWLKGQRRPQIVGNLLLFSTLGGFGIALWFLWCTVIFGDPLYFQHGPYSAELQQVNLKNNGGLYTYHDLWQSVRYYAIASIETLGPILFVLAVVAVVVFVLRRWRSPDCLGALVLLTPFAFYVISLYSGQAAIYVPGAVPSGAPAQLFNTRYGVEVVAPAAIFLATLVSRLRLAKFALVLVIVAQTIWIFQGGVITLQEGQYGVTCWPTSHISIYLAEHYNGGRILNDVARTYEDYADANIDFKNVVYQGSGDYWQRALKNPEELVDWVVIQPGDDVSKVIDANTPAFLAQFTLVEQDGNIELFHRRGLPPLPTRSAPSSMFTDNSLCGRGNAGHGTTQSNSAPQSTRPISPIAFSDIRMTDIVRPFKN